MTWLSRLKKISTHAESDATEPTKPIHEGQTGGFVGFVASILAPVQKIEVDPVAANDPAPTTTVQAMPTADSASGAVIDIDTIRPPDLPAKLLAASLALDAQIQVTGALPGNGPDSDCWPHGTAMTGSEIDLFTARLGRFTDKGVNQIDAESLADKLVIRDRDGDDRRLCLECTHLAGYGRTGWRCGNWRAAGVAIRPRDTQLPADLALRLQRCDGFSPHHTSTPQRNDYEYDRH